MVNAAYYSALPYDTKYHKESISVRPPELLQSLFLNIAVKVILHKW